MPDRGCEGTLLSVYHTPIAVLKKLRVSFGGLAGDAMPETEATKGAPLSPIQFSPWPPGKHSAEGITGGVAR